MAFPIAEAQLAALFMQSVTYGIHVVTFAMCMYAWFRRSPNLRTSSSWPWMVVAIALFAVGTVDVCFNLYHNLIAFILYVGPGGAESQFEDISNWVNVIRSVWYYTQALISDAALIYRCWVIFERKLVALLLPALLWLAACASAAVELFYMFTLNQAIVIPQAVKLQPYYHTFFATSLAVNVLTTTSIVYRVWVMHRQSSEFFTKTWRGSGRANLVRLNRIFVESALLYTLSVGMILITEITKTNGNYGASDISLELAGICFDLIIIRIWSGVSVDQTKLSTELLQPSHISPWQGNPTPAKVRSDSAVLGIETMDTMCPIESLRVGTLDDICPSCTSCVTCSSRFQVRRVEDIQP